VTKSLLAQVTVSNTTADLAVDELWSLGATGIELRETDGDLIVLAAGFPTAEAVGIAVSRLGARYLVELVEVDDAGWRDVWRQYAEPVDVGKVVVAPAWRPVTVATGRVVVHIDPGPCFGSGSHPTTRLLLAEIERRVRPGDGVLDVGTGSGILAVTAALLGAGRVTAVDVDPDSVGVARANAARNEVAGRVRVSTDDLHLIEPGFDLVVANLTAGILAELASALAQAPTPGGLLLVSGLLPGQWAHLATRFGQLDIVDLPELEGWTGAVLRSGVPPAMI
jgi:ribosomal protein L11 methyltransferase